VRYNIYICVCVCVYIYIYMYVIRQLKVKYENFSIVGVPLTRNIYTIVVQFFFVVWGPGGFY
jgi:hypothetical protein